MDKVIVEGEGNGGPPIILTYSIRRKIMGKHTPVISTVPVLDASKAGRLCLSRGKLVFGEERRLLCKSRLGVEGFSSFLTLKLLIY